MTLRQKITKAVNELTVSKASYQRERYEDDYDGFTHASYGALVDEIEDELFNEGYDEDAPMSVIEDFAFELF